MQSQPACLRVMEDVHTAFILSRRAVTQLPLLHLWVGTTLHTKA